jgi:hypothetical protein
MLEHYRPRRPKVVCESFDDEVVIVNLDSGAYYSLSGSGVEIWNLIDRGSSLPTIFERLTNSYAATPELLTAEAQRLIGELLEEQLIVALAGAPSDALDTAGANTARLPFVPPVLSKFSDMEDLLLLDPIHDVDETGWPAVKPELAHSAGA